MSFLKRIPWLIVLPCLLIPLFGLAGMHRADQLGEPSTRFQRQVIWLMIAWPAMIAMAIIPYRILQRFSGGIYMGSVSLLVFVLFMPPINGSRRWIPLGVLDFQPSEVARLAVIISLAAYLMHRSSQRTIAGLMPPLVMTLIPLLLIFKEPDLGTAALFLPILYTMLIAAGARWRHLLAAVGFGAALLPILWLMMNAEQRSRVTTVFQQKDGGTAPSGDGYHLHQSKQIIALGGAMGSVVDDESVIDDPTAYALPAARTDFILAVIAERYGLAGVVLLMIIYAVMLLKGLHIAAKFQEPFGQLLATGITAMIGTQTLINAAMIVGLVPITGITLPLCSYGGSSLVATHIAIGILISVAIRPGYDVGGAPVWES